MCAFRQICSGSDAVVFGPKAFSDAVNLSLGHIVPDGGAGDAPSVGPIGQNNVFFFCQTSVCLHSPKQLRVPQKVNHRLFCVGCVA